MDFAKTVKEVVENSPGALAGLIMAMDGIPVADYVKPEETVDIQTLGIEYTAIVAEIKKAADVLNAGEVEELAVRTGNIVFLLRLITEEYFIALVMGPEAYVGKGKFMLRIKAPLLREEF